MRLRYLHLRNLGVLKDLRVPFDREPLFRESGELFRQGDLHFVVGLNGTGKSSLLRALYQTFRWLETAQESGGQSPGPFPFPVTLVYDLPPEKEKGSFRTCIFHHPGQSVAGGFFYIANYSIDEAEYGGWDGCVQRLQDDGEGIERHIFGTLIETDQPLERGRASVIASDQLKGNQLVLSSLPNPLLVYTSGCLTNWNRIHEPELALDDLSVMTSEENDGERPRGWDLHQELGTSENGLSEEQRDELRNLLDSNTHATAARSRLLDPLDLKLAAIAIGLTVAAGEVTQLYRKEAKQAWRNSLIQDVEQQRKGTRPDKKTARVLLNEIDWWFPTHLTIEYRPSTATLIPEWQAQLLALCALSDEVIRQPLGRMQFVINLGPRTCRVRDDIKAAYGNRDIPVEVKEIVDRVECSTSGAQAVLRTLCTEGVDRYQVDIEPTFARWPVFETLLNWRKAQVIDNATVTIKRVTQMKEDGDPDSKLDDVVVTWDDLSDGEQMLLGRMSLLLLLSGCHGTLLLLDEPETHFNDSWKREIIDIVDDNVLKTTAAHVVVSTHTSIALTDAFASEIIRLIRVDGKSVLKPVTVPTFGAAPSRVMTHVFDMPASIGSRAEQALRWYMERGTENTVEELESLLANIGNGWPMAKLQRILDELNDAAPNS